MMLLTLVAYPSKLHIYPSFVTVAVIKYPFKKKLRRDSSWFQDIVHHPREVKQQLETSSHIHSQAHRER